MTGGVEIQYAVCAGSARGHVLSQAAATATATAAGCFWHAAVWAGDAGLPKPGHGWVPSARPTSRPTSRRVPRHDKLHAPAGNGLPRHREPPGCLSSVQPWNADGRLPEPPTRLWSSERSLHGLSQSLEHLPIDPVGGHQIQSSCRVPQHASSGKRQDCKTWSRSNRLLQYLDSHVPYLSHTTSIVAAFSAFFSKTLSVVPWQILILY